MRAGSITCSINILHFVYLFVVFTLQVNCLSGTSGFDMGPSLLDEVFKALGGNNSPGTLLDSNRPSLPKSEDRGIEFKTSFSKDTIKRKQATVN